jgi:DNA polymerase-3 subunit gamma/tau
MALTPRQAATLFFGTSLFGLMTFTSGLMIGVGIGGVPSLPGLPNAAGAPVAGVKPKPAGAPQATAAAQAMAAPQAAGASVMVPMPKPAPAVAAADQSPPTSAAAAPAAAAPPALGAAGAQPAPAAAEPVAVKDFRVGLPLAVSPVSPLRGRLVDAALAAPRSLILAPPVLPAAASGAPATQPGAGAPAAALPASAAPPQAAPVDAGAIAAAPGPQFMFSVQVGSFLVKGNAERLVEELNNRGYAAQVLMAKSPGEPVWYPVVLAPVGDVETVAQLAQEFAASEGRNAEVVSWLAAK